MRKIYDKWVKELKLLLEIWQGSNSFARGDTNDNMLCTTLKWNRYGVYRSVILIKYEKGFLGLPTLEEPCWTNSRWTKIIRIFQYCNWSLKYFSSLVTSSATQFGLVRYITCRFTYFTNLATPINSLATFIERVWCLYSSLYSK